MKILLIEDESAIADVIKWGLEEAHYAVEVCDNGADGLDRASQGDFALILLDIMLPGMDGWDVCRTLRSRRSTTPIMMLTAREGLDELVKGLDMGADDYITKPFDFPELLARIRALLRRDKVHRSRLIQVDDLTIDVTRRRVFRGSDEINLTEREYTLLEALASNEGQALTREFIQERVWNDDTSYSNTVDAYIRLLRKKIDAGRTHRLIHTIHGVGYTMRSGATDESTESVGQFITL